MIKVMENISKEAGEEVSKRKEMPVLSQASSNT